jgi:hypothetical protein
MATPCKVYYPRGNKRPDKVLVAKDATELANLLRIGWKLEASK